MIFQPWFALIQLVEKWLEMHGRLAMGFVDLLRKMVYACRRFGQNSREQTSTTGSVGGMEGGVQEARTWVGHQREELTISLEGKEIKQVDGFVYLR